MEGTSKPQSFPFPREWFDFTQRNLYGKQDSFVRPLKSFEASWNTRPYAIDPNLEGFGKELILTYSKWMKKLQLEQSGILFIQQLMGEKYNCGAALYWKLL